MWALFQYTSLPFIFIIQLHPLLTLSLSLFKSLQSYANDIQVQRPYFMSGFSYSPIIFDCCFQSTGGLFSSPFFECPCVSFSLSITTVFLIIIIYKFPLPCGLCISELLLFFFYNFSTVQISLVSEFIPISVKSSNPCNLI